MSHPLPPHTKSSSPKPLNIWAIGLSLGAKIAGPLVMSVLVGIKLDKTFGTLPLFTILAMIGSFIVSTLLIARDIKRVTAANEPIARPK